MTVPFQRKAVYLLVLFNIIPQIGAVPYWVILCSLFLLLLRWRSEGRPVPRYWNWLKYILTVSSATVIYVHYGTLFGMEPSAALLTMMMAVKLFEFRGYRDAMVITYLCYFLLMTKLLSSQSLVATLYLVIDVMAITSVLALFHAPRDIGRWKRLVSRAFRMTLQALPLFIVLFIFFPRFSANFMQKPEEGASVSSFGESIEPGSLSRLFLSEEVVFRASIPKKQRPHMTDLYWRGTVLDGTSNGLSWFRTDTMKDRRLPQPMDRSEVGTGPGWLIQDIFLEPSEEKWLFVLDWPRRLEFSDQRRQFNVIHRQGNVYESRREAQSRLYYRVFSRLQPLSQQRPPDIQRYLDVEGVEAPQSKELVESWKAEGLSEKALVQKISQHFVGNGFRYTLNPPRVSSLDEFIFETKKGVCEHYAATVATLLRLAGIPARVVLGFHGAESTLLDDYLIVREKNAHAWVEYYRSIDSTWQRLDPTGEVAPGRILLGADAFYDQLDGDFSAGGQGQSRWLGNWPGGEWARSVWAHTESTWLQAESAWVGFLLKYNFSYQQDLLARLGWAQISRWGLFALTLVALLTGLIGMLHWQKKEARRDPTGRLYTQLCRRLGRRGLPRERNEGPLTYKNRAMAQFPEQQDQLRAIFDSLIKARYGGFPPGPKDLEYMEKQVRQLRL